MATRRARPASDWQSVRKDLNATPALETAGKAPPARAAVRDFPGERVKVPPIEDVSQVEEISLPRKCCGSMAVTKCGCETATKDEQRPAAPATEPAAEAPAATVAPSDEPVPGKDTPKHTGLMLALWAPTDVAKRLAQPGGEHPDDMHVTLGYYGKVGSEVDAKHVDTIEKCVSMSVKGYSPVKARVGGVGRFNSSKSSDDKDVLVALVNSPGLHDVRDDLISKVQKCSGIAKAEGEEPSGGLMPLRTHGYTPHITLAYIDPTADMPVHKLAAEEFTFTHLIMAVGGTKKMYALGETVDKAHSMWCPVIKADLEERLVTGIVLQPEVVDAQGDIIAADVIKQAAHNFLALYNKKTQLGLQHEIFKVEGIELVESWVSPAQFEMNGRTILPGTWMMTVRVKNDDIWAKVKAGKFLGFSIGGVAKVRRIAA